MNNGNAITGDKYLDYIFSIVPTSVKNDPQSIAAFDKLLSDNQESILNNLASYSFPSEFIESENQKQNTFIQTLGGYRVKSDLDNWANFSDKDKLATGQKIIDCFVQVYGLSEKPVMELFTEDQYKQEYLAKYKVPYDKPGAPALVMDGNRLRINVNSLRQLGNIGFAGCIYHEMVHNYQKNGDFSKFYGLDKAFKEMEQLARNKEFYYFQPNERHSYTLQNMFEYKLERGWGVKKITTQSTVDKDTGLMVKTHVQNIVKHSLGKFNHLPQDEMDKLVSDMIKTQKGGFYDKLKTGSKNWQYDRIMLASDIYYDKNKNEFQFRNVKDGTFKDGVMGVFKNTVEKLDSKNNPYYTVNPTKEQYADIMSAYQRKTQVNQAA